MPAEPPDDEVHDSASAAKEHPPLERRRFGGSERPRGGSGDNEPPVSRSDLSKGPEELLEQRRTRINWQVLAISSAVILAFSIWAMILPVNARTAMKSTVTWIATNLGWYYVLTV